MSGKGALDLLESRRKTVEVGELREQLAADLIEALVVNDAAGDGVGLRLCRGQRAAGAGIGAVSGVAGRGRRNLDCTRSNNGAIRRRYRDLYLNADILCRGRDRVRQLVIRVEARHSRGRNHQCGAAAVRYLN